MANPEHVEKLDQGKKEWYEWRDEFDFIDLDLSYIKREKANFNDWSLPYCDFTHSIFKHVSFTDADLFYSRFDRAKLEGVDFSGAELIHTSFQYTIFDDVDFANAKLAETVFVDVDLRKINGLTAIKHLSGSHIDIDTLFKSKGQIPKSFLRGCGVSEDFIKLIPSLTSQPIQYYSCFISYSSKDDDFAHRLHNDLQGKGVRCWFAPEDMKIGDRIRSRIDQSIRLHDKLLLILPGHSISSQWVEKEVETAFEKERRNPGKTVLFPIRVDDAVMDSDEAWAADIRRTRHIGDFSNWKDHDSYQEAFDRLMRDLKASEE